MYPFWDLAIWPIIEASRARRIVEIGALRGETTALMLDRLGPDSEIHVIDPVPEFDPEEHERQFPGRYIFYRDISHNVLPRLPAVDVALIDGDHNWYTVYHELRMLADAARRDGAPLPVLILHDVCWPYGRRDLYYAPERIPEEFRQEYAQKGMRPGTKRLLPGGGLNPTMFNAVMEGGERNGVMTALDDFIAEHDRPVRRLLLPIYFGLEIVVEQARLDSQPELADALDLLETREGKDHLLELAETVRLQAMIFQHNVYHHRERLLTSAASRYLGLLKAALLNEIYLDHEARLLHFADCERNGRRPDPAVLRDPVRSMPHAMERLTAARRSGVPSDPRDGARLPYAEMGRNRLEHLERCLDDLRDRGVEGDLVECGTGRGGGAAFMRGYLDAHEIAKRSVWIADRFRVEERAEDLLDVWTDLNNVREGLARLGLLDDRVRFLQGPAGETLASAPIEQIALLRLGPGPIDEAEAVLDACYDRIVSGGYVVIDGYDSPDRQNAVENFRARHGIAAPIERADWWGATWRKDAPALPTALGTAELEGHPPLAMPAPAASKDLSVVVVFYNMKREAARTLHSLSHAYQQGVDDLDYEVIVVENGSRPDQRLGEELVRSFGAEFRYIDLGDDATRSPANALNRGLAVASGRSVAFMIDGAHVLTPGVLRFGMAGLSTYAPAVVATQQWYVGPGQQPDAMLAGYDQAYEDSLFRHVEWPVDGYRLFEIGHFIGDRDWLDGVWESNCIFVPRDLLEQIGAFDESFSMPGGGYANLDFYERVGATPGLNVVTILGEGSFHQIHGGTTTNVAEADARRTMITGFAEHYRDLRGHAFKGPGKTLHFVGTMIPSAKRTRARRMTAEAFAKAREAEGDEGMPTTPTPIPDELNDGFVHAFWHSLAWRDTTWLGHRVAKAPTDLVAYQELVERIRPGWVIETGAANGGRALFFASVFELLGEGSVISIDTKLNPKRAEHPRITYVEGTAQADETLRKVADIVGDSPNALVVLGSQPGSHLRIRAEFEAYRRFVPLGSYVIVENTILNGHPVWPGFGPGPAEAVKRILAEHHDFAVDPTLERCGLTFNRGGYLKRIS